MMLRASLLKNKVATIRVMDPAAGAANNTKKD
ncbi:MAG: hypothetical protein ACJA0I_001390 [Gammaproteobacteria bacterium]|jgi:hypothetical protein